MNYQERIYNQNGKYNRNFVGPVPTMSSDICVFDRPTFVMSGASSIDCPEVTCNINNVTYNDLFTGTTNCFTESALSGSCFNGVDWITNIYEDDVLVYSNTFYTTTNFYGPAIDVTTFSGSVVTAFDTLEYDYSFDGTGFTITKPSTIENIRLELTTELDYDTTCFVTGNTTGSTSCSCPDGYTATTALDSCQMFIYTAITVNGTGPTMVSAGDKNDAHGANGTYWWPSIDSATLPLVRNISDGSGTLRQGNTSGPTFTSIANVSSDFWGRFVSTVTDYGRLNAVGVKNSGDLQDWVGFSECIDIETSGTYYIGVGANNACRFRLNGELILNLSGLTDSNNFKVWHMLPVTLTSGKHIIEMEGRNDAPAPNASSFGAEIYSETLQNLTGATTTGDTGLIFSSFNRIGTAFDLGELSGNSCPSSYSLDACGDKSQCVKIESTNIECLFTGGCSTNEVICDLDFSGLTVSDSNVHLLTGQTTFDLTFDFTGNTSSFVDTNARFKYEIYKYDFTLGRFVKPAIYSSDYFEWSTFSATSAFTTAVTASTLNPDGQYLVKGHFLHDVCTEFGNRLGYTYDTTKFITGESYSIYEPSRDNHFIVFTEADEPILGNVEDNDNAIGGLTVSSLVLDGTTNEFNLPDNLGDYIIALNGLVLSPNDDYEINRLELTTTFVNNVKLSGETFSGDILTYIYTNNDSGNNIKVDTFDIDTPIVSGVTDGEGVNSVYYNTDTNKYEIFLSMTPVNNNDIGVTLNGVTLANSVDYYQSISNPKRIIFEGDIIVSDIITAYYNTNTNVQGPQYGTSITVSWSITNAPQTTDGIFTVEIADDENFTNIVSSATTDYVIGSTGYGQVVNLVGEVGDKQYYRVKNTKNFITLCSETLVSEKYSETATITIQTNTNNSY